MKRIVIATNNKNKIKEIEKVINQMNIKVQLLTLKDLNIDYDVEETGLTFAQNSKKKALEYFNLCNLPVITEDSGLCINVFNGLPGVFSKRMYENPNISSEEEDLKRNEIILENLSGYFYKEDRQAKYIAFLTYFDGNNMVTAIGSTEGYITKEISGDNGFSYDKIFYSNELKKKLSYATEIEKNSVSHRGKALKKLFNVLKVQKIV